MRCNVILQSFAGTDFAVFNIATEVRKHCRPTAINLLSPEVKHCLKGTKLVYKIHNLLSLPCNVRFRVLSFQKYHKDNKVYKSILEFSNKSCQCVRFGNIKNYVVFSLRSRTRFKTLPFESHRTSV